MLCLSIRTIRGSDFPSIVDLWNETHPYDPLTPRMFKRKVLLDVNFDPEDFFVAENKEKMVGFVYVVRRLCPLDNEVSPIFTTGWVNGFGVLADAPSETASLLLTKVDCFAKEYGLEKLCATAYSPFYFTQGFDTEHEADYIRAFLAAGYKSSGISYARDIDLLSYIAPKSIHTARQDAEAAGFSFGALRDELIIPFWNYMNKYQSAGWRNRIRKLMYDTDDFGRIRVATYQGEVIGFCVFHDPDGSPERFGPFGIRDCFRGRKLGQILLADCLTEMKRRGLHNAWMQWTESGNAADHIYQSAGFTISRSHMILEKNIGRAL